MAIALAFAMAAFFFNLVNIDDGGKRVKGAKKYAIISAIIASALIFTPNAKDMYVFLGVGGTIDYIKKNDVAKTLPDKCVLALDKLLEEYMDEEE